LFDISTTPSSPARAGLFLWPTETKTQTGEEAPIWVEGDAHRWPALNLFVGMTKLLSKTVSLKTLGPKKPGQVNI
jgi:hypothetical protein